MLFRSKNAYLFCGPHGCGKTTVARLFARDINNGEGFPIEIDAASNSGIDNVRNIISDAQQGSVISDYKVFIFDEAHQLSKAAWDAMLKIIEEPPTNVIFIFCTTNPAKIPDTMVIPDIAVQIKFIHFICFLQYLSIHYFTIRGYAVIKSIMHIKTFKRIYYIISKCDFDFISICLLNIE